MTFWFYFRNRVIVGLYRALLYHPTNRVFALRMCLGPFVLFYFSNIFSYCAIMIYKAFANYECSNSSLTSCSKHFFLHNSPLNKYYHDFSMAKIERLIGTDFKVFIRWQSIHSESYYTVFAVNIIFFFARAHTHTHTYNNTYTLLLFSLKHSRSSRDCSAPLYNVMVV